MWNSGVWDVYTTLYTPLPRKTTIDLQILLEECSFMIHHFLWKSSIIFMPDSRCQTWRFMWSLLLNSWVNRFTNLEGVLWTNPPDPKPRHPWPPWYNMMILYLKVVICWITWGMRATGHNWPDPPQRHSMHLFPKPDCLGHETWGPRPWSNTRLSILSQEVFKHLFPKPDSRPTKETCESSCCKHINHWLMAAMSNLIENLAIHNRFGLFFFFFFLLLSS